jgi:hypothetical protein
MLRIPLLALLCLATLISTGTLVSAADPTPSPAAPHASPSPSSVPLRASHPATIEGKVIAVDFNKLTITLQSAPPKSKRYDVNVSASTTFQGRPDFTAISDVKRYIGANLRVTASQKGDDYLAQTVTLLR